MPVGVTRIVPDLPVSDVGLANTLYAHLFGLEIAMDLGWVGNLGPAERPSVQLQVMTSDETAPCNPVVSIGVACVADVDEVHGRVLEAGLEIVHPPTDESWGVHRFFFRDPDGNVVNVVAHRTG
ncbi:MAG: VOC family protein [Jatrophihabitantaceae bacterium]